MSTPPANSLFITATDTSVGKTLVSTLLLDFLLRRGIEARYQKWVSTGDNGVPADLKSCLEGSGLRVDPERIDQQVPFRFKMAASPHLAAEQQGKTINTEELASKWRAMGRDCRLLIVEGVGGLLVPLRRDMLLADLLANLGIPTVVVARSGLGTLNHTLLTLEAMHNRAIPTLGVVFSDSNPQESELLVADNMKTIASMGHAKVLGRLPWLPKEHTMTENREIFAPIGHAILAAAGFHDKPGPEEDKEGYGQ